MTYTSTIKWSIAGAIFNLVGLGIAIAFVHLIGIIWFATLSLYNLFTLKKRIDGNTPKTINRYIVGQVTYTPSIQDHLNEAIENEDFKRAAYLRDLIQQQNQKS